VPRLDAVVANLDPPLMTTIVPIGWSDGAIRILDQTRLPAEEVFLDLSTIEEVAEAIRSLRVRGAPLIGVAAAMGLAAVAEARAAAGDLSPEWLAAAADRLEATRPTAVDLRWVLDLMRRAAQEAFASRRPGREVADTLRREAQRIWDVEIGMCRAIGEHGAALIEPGSTVLTHCNAGALATGGLGTALAVIYVAHEQGKGIDVIATETRPLRQGARLTAWELVRAGVPTRVIVDGAAAALMAQGEIDLVITGADRIAANGDVANKIGTYALATLAAAHGIPFFVAAPRSTFDVHAASGEAIPIEERPAAEIAPAPGASAYNPAFDVTPADLIAGIVTDAGVLWPPLDAAIGAYLRG
jgi:methylthioribose-1-phosphate isomerase